MTRKISLKTCCTRTLRVAHDRNKIYNLISSFLPFNPLAVFSLSHMYSLDSINIFYGMERLQPDLSPRWSHMAKASCLFEATEFYRLKEPKSVLVYLFLTASSRYETQKRDSRDTGYTSTSYKYSSDASQKPQSAPMDQSSESKILSFILPLISSRFINILHFTISLFSLFFFFSLSIWLYPIQWVLSYDRRFKTKRLYSRRLLCKVPELWVEDSRLLRQKELKCRTHLENSFNTDQYSFWLKQYFSYLSWDKASESFRFFLIRCRLSETHVSLKNDENGSTC